MDAEAFRAGTAWARVGFVPAEDHAVTFSYTRQDTSHTYYPYLQMDAVYDDADRFGLTWEATPSAVVTAAKLSTYYTQVDHWMTDEYRTTVERPRRAAGRWGPTPSRGRSAAGSRRPRGA